MSLQSRRKDQVSSDAEPVSSSQISRTEATSLLHDNEISSSSLIPVIVVVGSTSVGKTKLSVDLAKALNGEVRISSAQITQFVQHDSIKLVL